jgi:hypothetical protein
LQIAKSSKIDADALWYKLFPEEWGHDFGDQNRRAG